MDKKYTLRFTWYVTFEMFKTFGGLFTLHKLTLEKVIDEGGEDVKTFVMRPKKKINYKAGQYGVWFVPRLVIGKPARLFTISSSPTEDTLSFTTHVSGSPFKKKLDSLPIGSSMYMVGPLGVFTLGKTPPKHAVLVAGGIGATPMRSIAKFVHDTNTQTELTLVHVSRELYIFRDEFKADIPNRHLIHRDNLSETMSTVSKTVPVDTPFYLSGPPAFVLEAESTLRKHGMKNIIKDGFLGY